MGPLIEIVVSVTHDADFAFQKCSSRYRDVKELLGTVSEWCRWSCSNERATDETKNNAAGYGFRALKHVRTCTKRRGRGWRLGGQFRWREFCCRRPGGERHDNGLFSERKYYRQSCPWRGREQHHEPVRQYALSE